MINSDFRGCHTNTGRLLHLHQLYLMVTSEVDKCIKGTENTLLLVVSGVLVTSKVVLAERKCSSKHLLRGDMSLETYEKAD